MQFKRGGDIKQAVGVGQSAIAPEVKVLYQLNPGRMEVNPATAKLEPHKAPIADSRIQMMLEDVQDKNERAMNPRFLGFLDENNEFRRLHKLRGLFVKYKDVTYKIPK